MKHLLFVLIALSFASCDCVQRATGVILDSVTKRPIAKVEISKPDRNNLKHSDSSGVFEYTAMASGRGCPDLVLYFSKPGYKTKEMTFDSNTENDTVYLERSLTWTAPISFSINATND